MHSPSNRDGPSEPHAPQGKDAPETSVIPVIQEEATVSRTTEKTGAALRVRIESREEKQRIPVSEIVEEASVERVAINRYVSERTGVRCEGDVVIVPVFETVPVIEERLLLKEEIRIVRRTRELRREEEVVLHKETPVIERRASEQDNWSEDVPESKP